MKTSAGIFRNNKIRRFFDEKSRTWYFAVTDIIRILLQLQDYRAAGNYWKGLKSRLKKEGNKSVAKCIRLRMKAADGKNYLTDATDPETLLRIIQSVPGTGAEPVKLWLAKAGFERMQDMTDPVKSLDRARDYWKQMGRSEKWIRQRMTEQETRNELTDYWKDHDIKGEEENAVLADIIHREWSGISVKEHKDLKGIKYQNLRDHMNEAELIFTALAEFSARRIAESVNATGLAENKAAAKKGGGIAGKARKELESGTGRKVVTGKTSLATDTSIDYRKTKTIRKMKKA